MKEPESLKDAKEEINKVEKLRTEITIGSKKEKAQCYRKRKNKQNKSTRRTFHNRNSKEKNERKMSEF